MLDDGDFEEEDENEKLKCKSGVAELDKNLRVAKEDKEKEKAARDAKETLKAQKTIFSL